MRIRSTVGLSLAALLAISSLGAVGVASADTTSDATAPEPVAPLTSLTPPSPTRQATPSARSTLRAVKATFASGADSARAQRLGAGRDLTLLLRDLRAGLPQLSGADRTAARHLLARPTDGIADPQQNGYGLGANPTFSCGTNICLHWATAGADAPVGTDVSPANGVPDFVDLAKTTMDNVWNRIVTQGGYRAPLPDLGPGANTPGDQGPNTKFDVYLADIGDDGLYGYCTTDDTGSNARIYAYCVLDNDFDASQFPTHTPAQNLQVTAAHEFFHAVQYAYDSFEDSWLLETTAAWMEDELYPAVNDNLQYLADSPMRNPSIPLDYSSNSYLPYGGWIFWRYLTEKYPGKDGTGLPVFMRSIIQGIGGASATDYGPYSTQSLTKVLKQHRTTVAKAYAGFAVANRRPKKFYDEGNLYPTAPLDLAMTLGKKAKGVQAGPAHLSSGTVRLKPGSDLTARSWKVRVKVNMPAAKYGYATAVTVFKKGGGSSTAFVTLNRKGDGSKAFAFSRKTVSAIEVTLVNGSVRYTCGASTPYACSGTPKDDGRRVTATFSAFR